MTRTTAIPLLSVLAALTIVLPGSAQDGTTIRAGETVTGSLSSSDATDPDGSHYDDYVLELAEAGAVVIELSSDEFDTFLELHRSGEGGMSEIATDDDSGGNLDSRIRHDLDEAGTYVIRATSYGSGATGRYRLSVEEAPEVVVTPPRPIADGETLEGRLEPHDPVYEGGHYDEFTFTVDEDARVRVTLESDVFDAYLFLGTGEGGDFRQLASDDDGGSLRNSALTWTPSSAGTYTIRASSFGDFEEGPYRVSLMRLPDPVTADPESYPGGVAQGALELTDAQGPRGGFGMEETFYDEWTFRGRAGDRVVVSLTSTAFDTFLQLGRGTGEDFDELKSDDDGGANLDSFLGIVLPFDGTYTVRVSSVNDVGEGTYSLEIITLQ